MLVIAWTQNSTSINLEAGIWKDIIKKQKAEPKEA